MSIVVFVLTTSRVARNHTNGETVGNCIEFRTLWHVNRSCKRVRN